MIGALGKDVEKPQFEVKPHHMLGRCFFQCIVDRMRKEGGTA
jgi:hypothetical protein